MRNLRAHAIRTNMSSLIRRDTLDGRQYIVCPTILINEGVYNGVFYPGSELSKHTDAWNGRPLVNGHPTVRGKPVTANSKKVKETSEIGLVLNTEWDGNLKALKAEAWIDQEKCRERAPKILKMLEDEEGIDVSTGLFTDDDMRANSFNGKDYDCTALNHRPDHLAILPDTRGACSWNDGAGLPRINEAAEDDDLDESEVAELTDVCDECGTVLKEGICPKCSEKTPKANILSRIASFFGLKSNDYLEEITEMKLNEASFNERIQKIQTALSAKVNPALTQWGPYACPAGPMPWISDVYETWFVYTMGDKTYKVSYEWDSDLETVTFTSEPSEVESKRVFVPKTNGGSGSGNFGHSGRPGEQGGSGGGGGSAKESKTVYGEKSSAKGVGSSQGVRPSIDEMRQQRPSAALLADMQSDVADRLSEIASEGEVRAYADSVKSGEMGPLAAAKELTKDSNVKDVDFQRTVRYFEMLKPSAKQNEFLDPCGSEQPPTWAQQEGSPSMDKLMKVNSLIQAGHIDASLRETMLAAPEAVVMAFDQLSVKVNTAKPTTLEEALKCLSAEEAAKTRDFIAKGKTKDDEEKEAMKKLSADVKANTACPFTAEQVDALSFDMLKTLAAKLPKAPQNHQPAGGGAAPKANADDDAPPEMPSVDEFIKANAAK